MSKCLGCGAPGIDGDLCSEGCWDAAEANRWEALIDSGKAEYCRDCSEPTLKADMDGWQCCPSCAEKNNDRAIDLEAGRQANR